MILCFDVELFFEFGTCIVELCIQDNLVDGGQARSARREGCPSQANALRASRGKIHSSPFCLKRSVSWSPASLNGGDLVFPFLLHTTLVNANIPISMTSSSNGHCQFLVVYAVPIISFPHLVITKTRFISLDVRADLQHWASYNAGTRTLLNAFATRL